MTLFLFLLPSPPNLQQKEGNFVFENLPASLSPASPPNSPKPHTVGPPTEVIGRPPAESKGTAPCCRGWWPTSRPRNPLPGALITVPMPFLSYKERTKGKKKETEGRGNRREERERRGERTNKRKGKEEGVARRKNPARSIGWRFMSHCGIA